MKLIDIWKRLNKQPLHITQYTRAKVFIEDKEYYITDVKYESGRPLGFNAVPINCNTCKNNVEFPPPHTCDVCTSLDEEEMYSMWEAQ